jgi:hypothetical protein
MKNEKVSGQALWDLSGIKYFDPGIDLEIVCPFCECKTSIHPEPEYPNDEETIEYECQKCHGVLSVMMSIEMEVNISIDKVVKAKDAQPDRYEILLADITNVVDYEPLTKGMVSAIYDEVVPPYRYTPQDTALMILIEGARRGASMNLKRLKAFLEVYNG